MCDVEGGAVYSKTSTFGSKFDGTALTPCLRSPTPFMAPAGIDFAHLTILVWNLGMVFEGTTGSEVVYEFVFWLHSRIKEYMQIRNGLCEHFFGLRVRIWRTGRHTPTIIIIIIYSFIVRFLTC